MPQPPDNRPPSPDDEPSAGYFSRPTDTHNHGAAHPTPDPEPSAFEFEEEEEEVDSEAPSDGGTSQFSRPTIPSEAPGPRKRAKKSADPARVRLGQYEIVREIGRGGMGIVYEGYQPKLDRRVALKVLPEHLSSNKGLVARFLVEARAVAKFHHPNIAAIYEIGEDDGTNYFAMEFIEGRTLSDLIIKRDLDDTEIIVKIVADASRALDYAHRAGVIHRDIKPSNIMLTDEGTVKIMDFGLARVEGDERLTVTGMTLGTPAYMSPEQAGSKLAGPIDHRSDIYSLGVVLYEMLTLRIPFDGRSKVEILRNIIDEKVPPPSKYRPDIAPEVERIILKALSKKADERYAAAGELANDLEKYLNSTKPHAADVTVWRRPLPARVLVPAAIVLIVVGIGMGLWIREASQPGVRIVAVDQPPGAAATTPAPAAGSAGAADAVAAVESLRAAGEAWAAASAAVSHERALSEAARPADGRHIVALRSHIDAIRLEWIEAARRAAAEGRFVDATRMMLCEVTIEAARRGEPPPSMPSLGGDAPLVPGVAADAAPDPTPGERLEALLVAALADVARATGPMWTWGRALADPDKGYDPAWPLAALAERAAAAQPERACALSYALAEEAPSPAVRSIHVRRVFETARAASLEWPGVARLVAAHRPALAPLQRELAFSEHRWRLREVLRAMSAAGGWRKGDPAALTARYDEMAAAHRARYAADAVSVEAGAFAGDHVTAQPRPQGAPRGHFEPGSDREAPMRPGLAAAAQGVKARFFPLTSIPRPEDTAYAALTAYTHAATTEVPLGDGPEQVKRALVLMDEDAERWIVLLDEDGDGDLAEESALSPLTPLLPDFRLASRFGTVMPLALKVGVLRRQGELGLAVETIGCRSGQILYDGRHLVMLRLWDLDSDGIFDDFEQTGGGEPGARLDWEIVTAPEVPGDPRQYQAALDATWLGAGRDGGGALLYSVRAAAALRDDAVPGDCIELPGGAVLRFAEIAPGGGLVYVDWESSGSVAGGVFEAPSRRPVAGARLAFVYRNFQRSLTADEKGQVAGSVPFGRCTIRIDADGYEPYESAAVLLNERNASTLSIALQPAGAATP